MLSGVEWASVLCALVVETMFYSLSGTTSKISVHTPFFFLYQGMSILGISHNQKRVFTGMKFVVVGWTSRWNIVISLSHFSDFNSFERESLKRCRRVTRVFVSTICDDHTDGPLPRMEQVDISIQFEKIFNSLHYCILEFIFECVTRFRILYLPMVPS